MVRWNPFTHNFLDFLVEEKSYFPGTILLNQWHEKATYRQKVQTLNFRVLEWSGRWFKKLSKLEILIERVHLWSLINLVYGLEGCSSLHVVTFFGLWVRWDPHWDNAAIHSLTECCIICILFTKLLGRTYLVNLLSLTWTYLVEPAVKGRHAGLDFLRSSSEIRWMPSKEFIWLSL